MKPFIDQLAQYADHHRDRRNIALHFVGIPMIVVAIAILLSRPSVVVLGLMLSTAIPVCVVMIVFYLLLDVRFGLVMAVLFGLVLGVAHWLAAQSTAAWLGSGIGLFVIGWVVQGIGHYYEGRKPAFVDDIIGLLIGPLFVVAEWGFMLGLRTDLQKAIEARVGSAHIRAKSTHS